MPNKGPKILYLDIETAPNKVLVWGLFNQNIGINKVVDTGSTLCWAAKWKGKSEIMFASVYHDGAAVMLKKIHDLLDEADIVVHYNGKSFDIPTLNKEFIIHGMSPPSPVRQIDLLQTSRKTFRFLSNKLDFVARALGIGNKVHHKGIELWIGCMENDEKSWKIMERYNKGDVRLLEKLYNRFLPWIKKHPNFALYVNDSAGKVFCPRCGSRRMQRRGTTPTESCLFVRYQCIGKCRGWFRGNKNLLDKDTKALMAREVNN